MAVTETVRCQVCGRRVARVYACEDCRDELTREGRNRLARTVSGSALALCDALLSCTQVIISGGRDKAALGRAMRRRDELAALDRALGESA